MIDAYKKRYRFRMVIPVYPAVNIYSISATRTTALGPVCVASAINRMEKWDVEVVDENNLRRHGPKSSSGGADHEFLQNARPADVVGLYGGLTSTIPRLYEVAQFYKSKRVTTVAGGQHFSPGTIPEALSSGVDYVVIGEGEETIKELLQALDGKQDIKAVKGIAYKGGNSNVIINLEREPISDFDALPLPDFSLVRYAKIINHPVERIRGCGMSCEFCTVKGKPRPSSPQRLLERISVLVETRDARKFFIVDDLFGQYREDTIKFCNMIRDYQKHIGKRLSLGVQIRLDRAKDTELLSAMRQANVNGIFIGLESPIGKELEAMNKRLKPEDMISLAKVFRKFGFVVHGMFIFGYPMKKGTEFSMPATERIRYFSDFIKKAKFDTIQVLLPVPLPGTDLRDRLEKDNRLYPAKDVGWEYYDGSFPLFEPDNPMTAGEMQRSAWIIMRKFYRFTYMFMIGLKIISFPGIIFFMPRLKKRWRAWYRSWRVCLVRFAGWFFLRKWRLEFEKGIFTRKLIKAEKHMAQHKIKVAEEIPVPAQNRPS